MIRKINIYIQIICRVFLSAVFSLGFTIVEGGLFFSPRYKYRIASIDPAKLCCVSCDTEHSIIGKEPFVVMFSDQNFVPTLNCAVKECISVVRIENCSLLELYEVALEMFENVNLPEGSVFLFGSVSYLGRTGTSIYARDWSEVVALCTSK